MELDEPIQESEVPRDISRTSLVKESYRGIVRRSIKSKRYEDSRLINLNREHLILMHAIIQKNENQTSRTNIKLPHESTILDLKNELIKIEPTLKKIPVKDILLYVENELLVQDMDTPLMTMEALKPLFMRRRIFTIHVKTQMASEDNALSTSTLLNVVDRKSGSDLCEMSSESSYVESPPTSVQLESAPNSIKSLDDNSSTTAENFEEELIEKQDPESLDSDGAHIENFVLMEDSNVRNSVKIGWLFKKPSLNSTTKQPVYCMLNSVRFSFTTDENSEVDKNNQLVLSACTIETLTPLDFVLKFGKRAIYFQAETPELALEWTQILKTYIREAEYKYSLEIKFEGWLIKRGAQFKNRKKRWCILREGFIYYYNDRYTSLANEHSNYKGKLLIEDCWVNPDEERSNIFKVHTENRTWLFTAATENEAYQWMKAIEEERMFRRSQFVKNLRRKTLKPASYTTVKRKREVMEVPVDVPSESSVATFVNLLEIKDMMEVEQFRYVRWTLAKIRHRVQEIKHEQGILDMTQAVISDVNEHFDITIRFVLGTSTCVKCKEAMMLSDGIRTALSNFARKEEISVKLQPYDFVVKIPGLKQYIIDFEVPVWTIAWVNKMHRRVKGTSPIDLILLPRDETLNQMRSPFTLQTEYSSIKDTVASDDTIQGNSRNTLKKLRSAIRQGSFSVTKLNLQKAKECTTPLDETRALASTVEQEFVNVSELTDTIFEVKILSIADFSYERLRSIISYDLVDNAKVESKLLFYIEYGLYYGGKSIGNVMRTESKLTPSWNETTNTDVPFSRLPPETRICFTFYCSFMQKNTPIGWVNTTLTDYTGRLKSGEQVLSMWLNGSANPLGTIEMNPARSLVLSVLFPEFTDVIVYPEFLLHPPYLEGLFYDDQQRKINEDKRLKPQRLPSEKDVSPELPPLYDDGNDENHDPIQEIKRISRLDPISELTQNEKVVLWKYRNFLADKVEAIPKLVLSANMENPEHRRAVHKIVDLAPLIEPEHALQMLDYKYPDSYVRSFAVQCLSKLDDNTLSMYLLQLVQVLKYEAFHISELGCFLIERALKSPTTIGHALFWHFQSEIQISNVTARFRLLQECFLLGVRKSIRGEIEKEIEFVHQLSLLNAEVTKFPPQERKKELHERLRVLSLPSLFSLPLNFDLSLKGIDVESCKIMDSAAHPMLIVFENVDPNVENSYVLCKFGDDLRQDSLTLQMFKIMDRLWKKSGLDLNMSIYGCVPTGKNMGMIEIVRDSETTAKIQKDAGGIMGAFKQTPLRNWFRAQNPESSWDDVVDTFTRSCAAYCVATYVIGIGDRHNDNIMVTKTGALFHIDFAHFLGNIMKFGAYKREKAPFVLTPEFAYVMGGEKSEQYQNFKDLCCHLYNVVRFHSDTFISLFALMLFTGIQQLSSPEDIHYLRKSLSTNKTDEQAALHFSKLIDESLTNKTTQINFAFHILAHPD